ncbi:FO synthase [compost metagenome]
MGREGAALCLQAGANDLGGVLMYESITRAAGGANGQLMAETEMSAIATSSGRPLQLRNTMYQPIAPRAALQATTPVHLLAKSAG